MWGEDMRHEAQKTRPFYNTNLSTEIMKAYMKFSFVGLIACGRIQSISSDEKIAHWQLADSTKLNLYKVYKIDSINSFYLIYARKGDSIYKIVSKKKQHQVCNTTIITNGKYEFKLHSQSYNPKTGKLDELPENVLLVSCFYYDDLTKICLERDSINDLHYADNVEGLCFLRQ